MYLLKEESTEHSLPSKRRRRRRNKLYQTRLSSIFDTISRRKDVNQEWNNIKYVKCVAETEALGRKDKLSLEGIENLER